MKKTILILLLAAAGCTSYEAQIQVTKPYEGHFMTTNDFHNATASMQLDKDESVWVLSNRTLKRVLKNVKEGK